MFTKDQIKTEARKLLEAGQSRASVYNELLPQVDNERKLAYAVSRYVDPATYQRHKSKLDALLIIIGLQVFFTFFGVAFMTGFDVVGIVIGGVIAALMACLGRMISKLDPVGFTLYFVLVLQNITHLDAHDFKDDMTVSLATLLISVFCMGYSAYVQGKLMPYMPFFLSPKRGKKAKYAFLEEQVS